MARRTSLPQQPLYTTTPPVRVAKRGKKGGGTTYERRDRPGTWVAELTIAGRTHKRSASSAEGAKGQLEAMRAGAGLSTDDGTLGAWLRTWSAEIAPNGVASKTSRTYASLARNQWLGTDLAKVQLVEVDEEKIENELKRMLNAGLTRRTVINARAVLSKAYSDARRAKRVQGNPVSLSKIPGQPAASHVRGLRLTEAVARRVSEAVAGSDVEDRIEVMIHTGVRPAEVCGLRREDIDLDEGTVWIGRSVQKGAGGWVVGQPKAQATSTRTITFPDELMPRLRRIVHDTPSGYLWTSDSSTAKPDDPERFSKEVTRIFRSAQIPLTVRDMRHLHATLLLRAGVPIEVVSRRLGHANVETTWRAYVSVLAEIEQERLSIWKKPKLTVVQ